MAAWIFTMTRFWAVVMPRSAVLAIFISTMPAANGLAQIPERTLESVVGVLPQWPGYPRGRGPAGPYGEAPEGSGVAIAKGGYVVTNLHVIAKATSVTLRRRDGRLLDARIVATDTATDLAVLKTDEDLPLLPILSLQDLEPPIEPRLGEKVCSVGNAFGLGLSVTCGVVSAQHRTNTGFNPVEDFIQTDAAVNPGASGGALVDARGHFVGLISAIFTKGTDANIGVNFATSSVLVHRVANDLIAYGEVRRADAGITFADLDWNALKAGAGAKVLTVAPRSAAARAGLQPGDVVVGFEHRAIRRVGESFRRRPVRRASDALTALFLCRTGDRIALSLRRNGETSTLSLKLE